MNYKEQNLIILSHYCELVHPATLANSLSNHHKKKYKYKKRKQMFKNINPYMEGWELNKV